MIKKKTDNKMEVSTSAILREAKELGKKFKLNGVIILGIGSEHIYSASYGKDKIRCKLYAAVLDKIIDRIEKGELI